MELNASSQRLIARILEERTGQIIAGERMWRIPTALAAVARNHGAATIDALLSRLPHDTSGLEQEIAEALLNHETRFFRERAVFDDFADIILPRLRTARADCRRISVWSCACSSGQEVLSAAMIVLGQGDIWEGWDINFLGTDVSQGIIAVARAVQYNQFEIQRGLAIGDLLDYFDKVGQMWQAKPILRDKVEFAVHNILSPPKTDGVYDVIFCRNALIYFAPESRTQALENIARALAPDGVLIMGNGENPAEFHSGFGLIAGTESCYGKIKNF